MRWPWSREPVEVYEDERVVEAEAEAERYEHEVELAEQRRLAAELARGESREVSKRLWTHVVENGWTERLQEAWGRAS